MELHHVLKANSNTKAMSSPISNAVFLTFTIALLYVAYTIQRLQPYQTNLVFYIHDHSKGVAVAGNSGPNSNVLDFGTIVAFDDPVTVGPSIKSQAIGKAQGFYINSASDESTGLHWVFSVIFTDGEYRGSSLAIQEANHYSMEGREFGIVSGTGYFQFVKGYGIMETVSTDTCNHRSVFKFNVKLKHY